MDTNLLFELSNKNKIKEFTFNHFSYILIKKIIINSLIGLKPNDWSQKLHKLDLQLKIKCTENFYAHATSLEYPPVIILGLISPYHAQPVIEPPADDFTIPPRPPEYKNASIELIYNNDEKDENIRMSFIYELHERINFSEIFQENPDGLIFVKKSVYFNGITINSGQTFRRGVPIGGVNLLEYKQYDIAVIQGKQFLTIKGFFIN